ncbi:MAG TPA: response regulator transcription factor [Steroidobacteraceae bacterium]|nr:response regulator transcription factor [Steroidobacteraceae bacterium]
MSIRILIADDHPVIRFGLRRLLSTESDLIVVGEAHDGRELVQLSGQVAWDVAIVDYSMPGKGGIELVRELHERHPERPVLVLSIHPEDRFAMRALKAGAAGYLAKESAPEELVTAIRRVAAGGRYVTPALAENLGRQLNGGELAPCEALSDREYHIMWLIASGNSVGDIARRLFLSPNTVSTYRTRILRKMNLRNNADLVRYAIRNQLVQ